jgi:hypothetical protein
MDYYQLHQYSEKMKPPQINYENSGTDVDNSKDRVEEQKDEQQQSSYPKEITEDTAAMKFKTL